MENIKIIEAVSERDIDLLLLEELNVSESFSSWFYRKIIKQDNTPKIKGAWHSISDAEFGESDLIALYENDFAVLIENKIDAYAQPNQGERYHKRAEKGIKEGKWSNYKTCMLAPELYLQKEQDSQTYDAVLSYEVIVEWFNNKVNVDSRSAYKSFLLNEAIEQNRRGYTVKPDEKVTEFWQKYWELAYFEAPELEMKKPGIKPAKSDWPEFRPNNLNKSFVIVHKLQRGHIDLQITGGAEKIEDIQALLVNIDAEVVKTGKSASVRMFIEPIDRFQSFEEQKEQVLKGLHSAVKLLNLSKQFTDKILNL